MIGDTENYRTDAQTFKFTLHDKKEVVNGIGPYAAGRTSQAGKWTYVKGHETFLIAYTKKHDGDISLTGITKVP